MEYRTHGKHPECHGRDYTEVWPGPTRAPPEVVPELRGARTLAAGPGSHTETVTQCHDLSRGCHHLDSEDIVDGQPVPPRKAAHSPLE
jgi:hypothetical protein